MGKLLLYHGSVQAVPQPDIERCRPNNDYGRGFYCTGDAELAREWACQRGDDGFVSCYELGLKELKVVDLNAPDFSILHWLEVLFSNRLVRLSTPTMQRGARWLRERFSVNLADADVVHGYRADDSYFGFARAFLRNEITLAQLERAMKLGDLGTQYMVKSPRAFKQLRYLGSEPADASRYWPRQREREDYAREAFGDLVAGVGNDSEEDIVYELGGLYISGLMELSEEDLYAGLR